jgi:hypothetical protein
MAVPQNRWRSPRSGELLGLNDEEAALVDLKLGLAAAVKEKRARQRLTQEQLGKLLRSSQSRVAEIEAADSSVSIDLMIRSLIKMGASREEIASSSHSRDESVPPSQRVAVEECQ